MSTCFLISRPICIVRFFPNPKNYTKRGPVWQFQYIRGQILELPIEILQFNKNFNLFRLQPSPTVCANPITVIMVFPHQPTVAQCLASYFRDRGKFSLFFGSFSGQHRQESLGKNHEKNFGTRIFDAKHSTSVQCLPYSNH